MIAERVYRVLLLIYPAEHRREYGEQMVQLFRDRMRRDGGGLGTPVVWVHIVFDLVCSAFIEHQEATMLEGVAVKRTAVRSAKLLLWSLVGALSLYLAMTVAVMTAVLVSLLAGWTFVIESGSGPVGFFGFTAQLDNRPNFAVGGELKPLGLFVLVAGSGLLIGIGRAAQAVRTAWRS